MNRKGRATKRSSGPGFTPFRFVKRTLRHCRQRCERGLKMITKESVKSEIDKIQDQYLETLYHIIKAFKYVPESKQNITENGCGKNADAENGEWLSFIKNTYGCLSDDPIERRAQGEFEIREGIH